MGRSWANQRKRRRGQKSEYQESCWQALLAMTPTALSEGEPRTGEDDGHGTPEYQKAENSQGGGGERIGRG